MLSRFSKTFLFTAFVLFLFTTLFVYHRSDDPWSKFTHDYDQTMFTKDTETAPVRNVVNNSPVDDRVVVPPVRRPASGKHTAHDNHKTHVDLEMDLHSALAGGVIMDKLGNETTKAALGQATWKLLHTVTLRFPEEPTQDQRDALKSYFYLTSRLYPCGECAAEFQALLKEYPPQTSSRKAASQWLCHVHNMVNKRLEKPEFDCAYLDSTYDCGCGDTEGTSDLPTRTRPEDDSKSAAVPIESPPTEQVLNDPTIDDVTGVEMIRGGRR